MTSSDTASWVRPWATLRWTDSLGTVHIRDTTDPIALCWACRKDFLLLDGIDNYCSQECKKTGKEPVTLERVDWAKIVEDDMLGPAFRRTREIRRLVGLHTPKSRPWWKFWA